MEVVILIIVALIVYGYLANIVFLALGKYKYTSDKVASVLGIFIALIGILMGLVFTYYLYIKKT